MRFFIFMFFVFFISCDYQTPQEKFVEIACDTYGLPECNFSKATRLECEKFVNAVYEGNTPNNPEKCNECMESKSCEMWFKNPCEVECIN